MSMEKDFKSTIIALREFADWLEKISKEDFNPYVIESFEQDDHEFGGHRKISVYVQGYLGG